MAGSVVAYQTDRYVLWALAGQTMTVEIVSPGSDVLLSVIGADGVPLKRYVDGLASWSGVLPKDQDYYLHAVATGGAFLTATDSASVRTRPSRVFAENTALNIPSLR